MSPTIDRGSFCAAEVNINNVMDGIKPVPIRSRLVVRLLCFESFLPKGFVLTGAENHRQKNDEWPYDTMFNHLQRANVIKPFPVNRKKTP
jgi:hypothetical protein